MAIRTASGRYYDFSTQSKDLPHGNIFLMDSTARKSIPFRGGPTGLSTLTAAPVVKEKAPGQAGRFSSSWTESRVGNWISRFGNPRRRCML